MLKSAYTLVIHTGVTKHAFCPKVNVVMCPVHAKKCIHTGGKKHAFCPKVAVVMCPVLAKTAVVDCTKLISFVRHVR
jgi:hypothetical protein